MGGADGPKRSLACLVRLDECTHINVDSYKKGKVLLVMYRNN